MSLILLVMATSVREVIENSLYLQLLFIVFIKHHDAFHINFLI
jgi:hypothetical protein